MKHVESGSSEYYRIFVCMLLGSMVTFAQLYYPQTLINTFASQMGISPSLASLSISLATFSLAVGMLILTVFSNAWGRKKIMGVSLLLASLAGIATSFTSDFKALVFLRVFQGLAMSGFPSVAITYLNEEISPKHIGRIMGIYVSGNAIGGFFGRIWVSVFADFYSWHAGALALGIFSFLCSALFFVLLPESKHFKKEQLSFSNWISGMIGGMKNKNLLCIYAMAFLLLGAYITLFNYIAFPLSNPPFQLSQTAIGFLFIFQLSGSWSSYFFGKLTENHSRSSLLISGVVMALAGALLTCTGNLFLLMAGLILFAAGFFAGHSLASGWVGVIAEPPIKVYASSLYLLFYYTGSSLLGWIGGFFLTHFGWYGVILMVSVLLIATILLTLALTRAIRLSHKENSIRLTSG
jgi:YNFM family putative membrane transporter